MDVLSNVLTITNLATHVQGAQEFVAPWEMRIDAHERSTLHIVRRGACWLHRADAAPLRLNAGDVVLLTQGDAHTLSSHHDGRSDPTAQTASLQSASYELSREGAHPLLALLPPVIHVSAPEARTDSELQVLLRLAIQETNGSGAGGDFVLHRLVDALFVFLVRDWLRTQPEATCGWLGALRDPQIGKALALIHERPQATWTVELLARSAAMSRAAFAKRFTDFVGEPPLTYITRWRMDLAAKMLRESREPVARIASKVGYISETAFAKAFRRRRQVAPGAYRFQRRAQARALTAH